MLNIFNPLNPKIKIWILMLPLFTPNRGSGEKLIILSKFILCDPVCNSHDYSVLQSIDNYKEKFDADHS